MIIRILKIVDDQNNMVVGKIIIINLLICIKHYLK